ncbi:MAG: hypothetical protein M9958_05745 [Chitinophagales bacterium]|nr:hypothetical protein [Chitinophagales bacterium]
MSSHHFVKENQEPAIWVLDRHFEVDTIHQLLEWSPTVNATLLAAEWLISLQIKIDKVYFHSHQTENLNILPSLYPIELINTENIENDIWNELYQRPLHNYIIGLNEEELKKIFFNTAQPLKQYLIGITLHQKWTCPPVKWNKWFAQDQQFALTGKIDEWLINGDIQQENGRFTSLKDQRIFFENYNENCLIELI